MQSRASRLALIAGAVAAAVVAFLVLRPGDDGGQPTTAAERSTTAAGESPDGETRQSGAGRRSTEGGQAPRPEPVAAEIEIENGEVVGGLQEIEVERGDAVELVIRSDTPDEVHLHGYDIEQEVGPGEPARFSFTADSEGIYEIEAHDLGHVQIGELRVAPS